jgi:unsaturated rhamnogalacturonyl hydrolase
MAAGFLRGIKLGILPENYKECAAKAIAAICDNVDSDGTVLNVSAGTAMGMDAQHYKNIQIRPMAYGQSLTLVALCEAL